MGWLWELGVWVFSKWPFWVPFLTFLFGIAFGKQIMLDHRGEQLKRLARRISFPDEWRDGTVAAPLDGRRLTRPEMADAALLIRFDEGHGSGVCISSQGLVLTNAHVVRDATVVEIEDHRTTFLGVVVKVDVERDVALLHVGAGDAAPVAVDTEGVNVGDDLFVSGTPLRMENKNLLTRGVVSKVGQLLDRNFIHMDAAIAPGNSGGPVFNESGCLVGLSVAVQMDHGGNISHIGLAIPIVEALDALGIQGAAASAAA